MNSEKEQLIMNLIVDAGSARSYAMQAIAQAKSGDIDGAREVLTQANEDIARAHSVQTDLIQNEAKGNKTEIDLFMVHAQDHIMTAILAKDMAGEMIDLYEKIRE